LAAEAVDDIPRAAWPPAFVEFHGRNRLASISTRNNSVTGMACLGMRSGVRQIE
jgi:hypothetical protein